MLRCELISSSYITAASAFCKSLASDSGKSKVEKIDVSDNVKTFYDSVIHTFTAQSESSVSLNDTILQKTEEKTFAQSRATMRSMMQDLQRSIVPKYATIPLVRLVCFVLMFLTSLSVS